MTQCGQAETETEIPNNKFIVVQTTGETIEPHKVPLLAITFVNKFWTLFLDVHF